MKKLLTVLLAISMILSLTGCSSEKKFTGSAQGFGGEVSVTISVDGDKITSVEVKGEKETPAIGGAALETLASQIKDAQSYKIDGVTGASVTSSGVKNAAKAAFVAAGLVKEGEKTAVADGTYTAKAPSFGIMNEMELAVTFADGEIAKIETLCAGSATQYNEDEYSEIYRTVEENLFPRIIENQSLAVDAIVGATVSSNAAKTIISKVIDENGGDSSQWYSEVAKKSDTVKLEGYDVIVVGLGASGMAAYLSAAENGATVFGIEAAAKVGGNGTNTAGPLAVNPPSMVAATGQKFVEEDELLAAWMEYTDNDAKEEIVKLMIEESGETLDWLTTNWDFGLPIPTMLAFYDPHGWGLWTFYYDSTLTSKDLAYVNSLNKATSLNEKNQYMTELTATDLIKDGDKVIGVEAKYYDGTAYEIYGDSVVLATGGYIGDAELSLKYTGAVWHTKAMTQCDGFGLKQALALGGNEYNPDVAVEDHIATLDTIIRDSSVSVEDKALLNSLVTDPTYTMIKSNGEEFDPNYNGLDINFNAWEAGSNYYVLINEDEYNAIKTTGLTQFVENGNGFLSQGGKVEVGTPITNLDEVLALGEAWGDVVIADSLADLEKALGFDIKLDSIHGKADGKVVCLIGAAYIYSTTGGVEVDENINLVKTDGTSIDNVYVVGNDSLGCLNESNKAYVTYGGCAQGWSLTSGRLAGANAAEKFAK